MKGKEMQEAVAQGKRSAQHDAIHFLNSPRGGPWVHVPFDLSGNPRPKRETWAVIQGSVQKSKRETESGKERKMSESSQRRLHPILFL